MNKKEKALKRQQEILSIAKAENRDLTPEEKREFDELQDVIQNYQEEKGLEDNHPNAPPENMKEKAIQEERKRTSEIMELCRTFDMSPDDYLKNGDSIENVREQILVKLKDERGPVHARAQVTEDEQDKFRMRASDALALRANVPVKDEESAREFRSMSLRDLGIECLSRSGRNMNELLRMDHTELYDELCREFYNPTAAFPAILDNTIRKSIVHIYNSVPTTFQAFTSKGTLTDFKETKDHQYLIGGIGDFEKVAENGEIKADAPRTELLPTRKLDTYGKSFSMTRQAFINDDISFLTEIPGLYATANKKTIDRAVYNILFGNSKIFDGVNLFDAKHGNVMKSASKPTQQAIQSMILKMQSQKDPFGNPIYMTPAIIIVPVGYGFDLAVLFNSNRVVGSGNNDYNPLFQYPIKIVESPVLNALAGTGACPWFMVADQTSAKGIQVDYLNGQEMPQTRRSEKAGTLGFTWDIWADWGISVRDFRGLVRNNGVKVEIEE